MYRFLLRPKWIAAHVLLVVFVTLFMSLGFWQLRRNAERNERVALARQRLVLPEVPLERLASPETILDVTSYRRVRVTGRYDTGREVVLVGRSKDGESGNHVLTPLVTEQGIIVVDRGWVPFELNDPPLRPARPPRGELTVRGVLLPAEHSSQPPGGDLPRRMRRIDTQAFSAAMRRPLVVPGYLLLQSQQPPQGNLPSPVQPPDPTEGAPHMIYAMQWFSLAAISLIGYAALIRKESREGIEPAGPQSPQAAPSQHGSM